MRQVDEIVSGENLSIDDVEKLQPGDQVYWDDPDAGCCSCFLTIRTIEIKGSMICIHSKCGEYLECFAHELY
jgi:hypothetical protein